MVEALRLLSPERRHLIEKIWSFARQKNEERFCIDAVYGDGTKKPWCIDLASWPAIGGDHSCSPRQLLSEVESSSWIMRVAAIAAETKVALRKAKGHEGVQNAWAASNLKLQNVDPKYASRATANEGHFLVTRQSNDPHAYQVRVLAPDVGPNAIGYYAYYHLAALAMAHAWPSVGDDARGELARKMLATETFAIHFLEDAFSAGHVAGIWGNVAERKGTHDYYCEFGLDAELWNGQRATILGDAHMRDIDRRRAGAAVAESLVQLTGAASEPDSTTARIAATISPASIDEAIGFDACTAVRQPSATFAPSSEALIASIVAATPVPGLGEGDVNLPRFREEIGVFIGFAGDLAGGSSVGGFESSGSPRLFGSSYVGFQVGLGLEALTGSGGSAQTSLGLGVQFETSQNDTGTSFYEAAGVPVVPARRGLALRLRLPYYLIPFDLLLASSVLSWAAPDTLTDMAIVAAHGGRLGERRALVTSVGSFQLLLGTEVGLTFYGYFGDRIDSAGLALPGAVVSTPSRAAFISYRSLQFDIPVFEYRPLRTFATKQALTLAFQLGGGFEIPHDVQYISKLTMPAASGPTPSLGTPWFVYLRIHFDTRYYF